MQEKTIKTRREFAELFHEKLIEKGISFASMKRDLADEFNPGSLYYYSKGQNFPKSIERLQTLCDYLSIDINSLDIDLLSKKPNGHFGQEHPPRADGRNSGENGSTAQKLPSVDPEKTKTYHVPESHFSGKQDFPGYKIGSNGERGLIVGDSEIMHKVFDLLYNINCNPDQESVVLITGETGTGKELIAKAVHYNGSRKNNPFVGINITTVTETLLEPELFGHIKGSFTDARHDKKGFFETVEDGTLFLDEIGLLQPQIQAKLLRVLQERYFYRVGDTETKDFKGRVTVATKENIEGLVKEGKFRDDLYYRLNVIRINLPRLKDRKTDLPLLFSFFIDQYNKKYTKKYDLMPSSEGYEAMQKYEFPGNVRELESLVKKAIFTNPDSKTVKIENTLTERSMERSMLYPTGVGDSRRLFVEAVMSKTNGIVKWERVKIEKILECYFDASENLTECSKAMRLTRRNIVNTLTSHGLEPEDLKTAYRSITVNQ